MGSYIPRLRSHLYFLVRAHGQLPALGQEHDGEGDESGGEDAGGGTEVPVGRGHHQPCEDPEHPDRRVQAHGEAYVESLSVVLADSPEFEGEQGHQLEYREASAG